MALLGSLLPMFLDNVLAPASRDKNIKNAIQGGCGNVSGTGHNRWMHECVRDSVISDWLVRKLMGNIQVARALKRVITKASMMGTEITWWSL
jgi:hypothetical protein